MRAKSLIILSIMALLLAACAAPTATPPTVGTQAPFIPAPTTVPGTQSTPATSVTAVSPTTISPAPGTSTPPVTITPPTAFEPQPGDENLKRDQAFLDMPSSQLVVIFGVPVQAEAILIGTMPDPCHALRVVVAPPDSKNTINIDAYSVVDPNKMCATVLSPFTATIPLGSFTNGDYSVTVDGELLGSFSTAFSPQPGDAKLTRGEVNLDLNISKLVTLSDLTGQEAIFLQGNLPDPCHHLRVVLSPADSQNKINLEVYSVYDPKEMCIMVIVPFQMIVPLGTGLSGHYSVYVNSQLLGEFDK